MTMMDDIDIMQSISREKNTAYALQKGMKE